MASSQGRRSQSAATVPIALTIAGSDSSAGAGIQADLKTFSALGVYGLTAVTCVVAETPGKVSRIEPVNAEIVRDQIQVVAKSFPIGAIKTGLLCTAEIVETIARTVVDLARATPLVVDPVFVATSGDKLLEQHAIGVYETQLFPIATLITPNLDEAAYLLGEKILATASPSGDGQDREWMEHAVRKLAEKYKTNVLLKGGHIAGDDAIDLLFANGTITEFSEPFVRGVATHGTGCTYSAAITAGLASGLSLVEAVRRAKTFVTAAIANHFAWDNIHALNHFL
jgi:hydroxymethylpyrimidine/phosphomethylpyrimidine kinase